MRDRNISHDGEYAPKPLDMMAYVPLKKASKVGDDNDIIITVSQQKQTVENRSTVWYKKRGTRCGTFAVKRRGGGASHRVLQKGLH